MLANPQRAVPFDSVLKEAFNNTLDLDTCLWPEPQLPEETECGVAPRPVELPGQNVPSMSMDDGLKLVDASVAEQQVPVFNNALGIHCTTLAPVLPRSYFLFSGLLFTLFNAFLLVGGRFLRKFEEVEQDVAPRQEIRSQRTSHSPLPTAVPMDAMDCEPVFWTNPDMHIPVNAVGGYTLTII